MMSNRPPPGFVNCWNRWLEPMQRQGNIQSHSKKHHLAQPAHGKSSTQNASLAQPTQTWPRERNPNFVNCWNGWSETMQCQTREHHCSPTITHQKCKSQNKTTQPNPTVTKNNQSQWCRTHPSMTKREHTQLCELLNRWSKPMQCPPGPWHQMQQKQTIRSA